MSNRNVTLADLATNVKAFSTVNFMDKKHYSYTMDQLNKSKESGSIFKKRDMIKSRESAPIITNDKISIIKDSIIPSREKSIFEIIIKEYDELLVVNDKETQSKLDEKYAEENVDLVEADLYLIEKKNK